MTVLGNTAKPTNSYFSYDGTSYPNAVSEILTAPQKIKVLRLGGWIGGWNDTVHAQLCVWALDGTLLGASAEFVVANEGGAGAGNTAQYEADLPTPVIIDDGVQFHVGINCNRDDARQFGVGTTSNVHYESRNGYPNGTLGSVEGPTSVARRTGMYVANYQPVSQAWVRRSGVWVQATSVQVRRSGVWADVDAISVLRSGTWADAQ